jgi:bifunctional non-homologous end joining protein LigD
MTGRYPEIAAVDLEPGLVLDGEIVATDSEGRPSFELLQGRLSSDRLRAGAPTPVSYVVFDVLHYRASLVDLPIEARLERLDRIELPAPFVRSDRVDQDSQVVWDFVLANDLEGIVAKRRGSPYRSGIRSPDWRKIGNFKQLRAVIGGYTPGTSGRSGTFGALLMGLWVGAELRWIGAVGSGFANRELVAIRDALDEMRISESPFAEDPEMPGDARWVEPHLVAMVRYKQWTAAGRVRAPSFKGFTGTPAADATWESEGPPAG